MGDAIGFGLLGNISGKGDVDIVIDAVQIACALSLVDDGGGVDDGVEVLPVVSFPAFVA